MPYIDTLFGRVMTRLIWISTRHHSANLHRSLLILWRELEDLGESACKFNVNAAAAGEKGVSTLSSRVADSASHQFAYIHSFMKPFEMK